MYYLNQLLDIMVGSCNQIFTLVLFIKVGKYLLNQMKSFSFEMVIKVKIIGFMEAIIDNFSLDFSFFM